MQVRNHATDETDKYNTHGKKRQRVNYVNNFMKYRHFIPLHGILSENAATISAYGYILAQPRFFVN